MKLLKLINNYIASILAQSCTPIFNENNNVAFLMDTDSYIPAENSFLKKYVSLFWQVDRSPSYFSETIIPGGVIEIIFNFSEYSSIAVTIGKENFQLPKCFINGYNTSPVVLKMGTRHSFFGIRLYPHTAYELFSVPAGEFLNQAVELTLLDKTTNSLWHQLKEDQSFKSRVNTFIRWISTKTFDTVDRNIPIIHFLANETDIRQNASSLSKMLFYSPRHLSRKFLEFTGMNIEEYLQYKRYLHAVNLIHFTSLSLTSIACESNFFDQSHFIRVFRQYAHLTPGEYRNLRSYLPGHIYQ